MEIYFSDHGKIFPRLCIGTPFEISRNVLYHVLMKIFGYKTRLPVRHLNDSHSDPDAISIFPEEDICEACHLYKDRFGNTYVGFDLSLNLPENIMCELLEFIESDELAIYEVMDS